MTDRLISIYLEEMEERLEAPYRTRAVIGDFCVSCALVVAIVFALLLL